MKPTYEIMTYRNGETRFEAHVRTRSAALRAVALLSRLPGVRAWAKEVRPTVREMKAAAPVTSGESPCHREWIGGRVA